MTTILPRRGTAAQWTSANPVLAMGELGFETDTKKWKRGDGVTAWNALAYYQPAWNDVTAKPAVIAAGADQAAARAAISAVGKGELVVNVKDYGAVDDGATDDSAAINSALSYVGANGGGVVLLGINHAVNSTLVIPGVTTLRGRGGHGNGSKITSSATSGAVVQLSTRTARLEHVRILSTSGRRAAVTTTGHGVFIAGDDVPSGYPSLSRIGLFDIDIRDQPTDGVHGIGPLEYSRLDLVTVSDCVRHGYVFDGGAVAGYSNLQNPPFMLMLSRCRAFECGGQAFICLTTGGNAPSGLRLDIFEALGCAWDSTKRHTIPGYPGSELFQVQLSGRGHVLNQPDIEDQQYANTTTATGGRTRTALATPANGVYSISSGVQVNAPYFSSLVKSWEQGSTTSGLVLAWPSIFAGNYGINQSPAIQIPSSSVGIDIRYLSTQCSGAAVVVRNQSVNARIEVDGIPNIGLATTAADWGDGLIPVSVTLAGDTLTTTSRRTKINGQGAAADNLSTIRVVSGYSGSTGMDIFLFCGAEDITIKHGVGNIINAAGVDVRMTASKNTVLHYMFDGTNWVQDINATIFGLATLDFPSVAAQSFQDLTITVTGAALGDSVALGVPTGSITAGVMFTAWVSATDTVTVRAHNYTAGPLDPASGMFKATIVR